MNVGIFDSGLGGLTVIKELLKEIPGISITYFGDTARLPYGTKSKKSILKYSKKNTEFLIKKRAKIIVIACNTSSAIATDFLKKKFKIPIFNVIEPAVESAILKTKNNKIGIIATPSTIKSCAYQKKIKEKSKKKIFIYSQDCPLFVPLIEEGWLEDKITKGVAEKYLKPFKKKGIDTLILGCTHYPLIKKLISKEMGSKVKIIDSAETFAKDFKKKFKRPRMKKKNKNKGFVKIFLSDEGYNFKKISKKVLGKRIFYKIV